MPKAITANMKTSLRIDLRVLCLFDSVGVGDGGVGVEFSSFMTLVYCLCSFDTIGKGVG